MLRSLRPMIASSKWPFFLWVLLFCMIVAAFLAGGISIRSSVAASFDTSEQIRNARTLMFNLLKAQLDEETGVRGYEATHDRQFLQPYVSARRQIHQNSISLERTLDQMSLAPSAAIIADAERLNATWLRSVATPLVSHRTRDPNALQRYGKILVDRFRNDTARVDQDLGRRHQEVREEFDADIARIGFLILSTALLLTAAALGFWALHHRAIDNVERERRQGEERAREVQTGHEVDNRATQTGYEVEKRTAETLQEASSKAQREDAERQLLHFAYHDALTGLPNRAFFLDRLSNSIMRMKAHPEALVAVLFLDIDRFKTINDSLGHAGGDQVLAALVRRLASCLRPYDMLARLGGDEFTILLEDPSGMRDACVLADLILHELIKPLRIDQEDVFATMSIGVAVRQLGSEDAIGMLRDADIAMYRAKQLGGGRYELFAHEMHVQSRARSQLEMDLRQALVREELRLVYQPIVSLGTGRITGFEALARWQHPERGIILPVEFIPLAEETGLIGALGEWVLAEACREACSWQNVQPGEPLVSVNVNVSAKQLITVTFAAEGFAALVTRVLSESGLKPAHLHLEITESALLDYAEATEVALQYIRSLGVAMQLDDFGTGYSSLSYLQRLPIDTVKIDRSFVSGDPGAGITNPQIVEAIIALAQTLGKRVTAEGIETVEQLNQLRALGCTSAQGYYLSRPLGGEAARAFLTHWQPPRNLTLQHPPAE